jgi:hypothetical protein
MYLLIVSLSMLSSCAVSRSTIPADLTRDTHYFTVYKKAIEVNGSQYVVEDTSSSKPIVFNVSPLKDEKKTADWTLQLLPSLGLTFDKDHFCQIDISNDFDSTKRTLLCVFRETSEGVSADPVLGDTVLILEGKTRIGYLLRTGADDVSILTFPRSEYFQINLNGDSIDIKHQLEGLAFGDDWFAFYRGDSLLATIGNAQSPPIGTLKYHAYIKNALEATSDMDLFFCYLAVEALGSFQAQAMSVQERH